MASSHLLGSVFVLIALAGCDDPKATAQASSAGASAPRPTTASASGASASPSSAFAPPDSVIAQHVLIAFKGADRAPKGVTRTKGEALKRAEEVALKANAGGDFSALVTEYSEDPAAGERQGSVGRFTREKMAKPFSDAAFMLRVGEISPPVETPFGYHVIKRNQ